MNERVVWNNRGKGRGGEQKWMLGEATAGNEGKPEQVRQLGEDMTWMRVDARIWKAGGRTQARS